MEKKSWYKSKTVWTAVVAIVTGAAGYFTDEMTAQQTLQIVATAMMGMFIRSGIGLKK